jgi:putative lipoic acid-binding regulatory protein
LCEDCGIAYNLRPIAEADVLAADEVLLSSATKEVLAVTRIDGQGVGHGALRGKPGPVYARLYEAYQAAKKTSRSDRPKAPMPEIPPEQSLIAYPSAFPIKVMGVQVDGFVDAIVQHRAAVRPRPSTATVETRPSKAGNYLGVTITVTATSRAQLDELYRTLSTHPMVKVVL